MLRFQLMVRARKGASAIGRWAIEHERRRILKPDPAPVRAAATRPKRRRAAASTPKAARNWRKACASRALTLGNFSGRRAAKCCYYLARILFLRAAATTPTPGVSGKAKAPSGGSPAMTHRGNHADIGESAIYTCGSASSEDRQFLRPLDFQRPGDHGAVDACAIWRPKPRRARPLSPAVRRAPRRWGGRKRLFRRSTGWARLQRLSMVGQCRLAVSMCADRNRGCGFPVPKGRGLCWL